MREHDMPEEISAYRVDDHLKQAMEEIELEVGKLSSWIESQLIQKECFQVVKAKIEEIKKKRKDKMLGVLSLASKLAETVKNNKIAQVEKEIQAYIDQFRIK